MPLTPRKKPPGVCELAAQRHLCLTVGLLLGLCVAVWQETVTCPRSGSKQNESTRLPGLPAGMTGQFETLCFVRESRQHCCQRIHNNSGTVVTWVVFEICCLCSPSLPSKTHTQMPAQAEAPKWPSFSNSGRGAF